jgi:hypothetical protein
MYPGHGTTFVRNDAKVRLEGLGRALLPRLFGLSFPLAGWIIYCVNTDGV